MRADIRPFDDADWAFRRYEEVRGRLPSATFPSAFLRAASLRDLADEFDVFVLDAYGVLNVGDEAIAGVPERIAALRDMGKRFFVLTNGASFPPAAAFSKYGRLGFDFAPDEIVASRLAASRALSGHPQGMVWGAGTRDEAGLEDLPAGTVRLGLDRQVYDRVDGFVLLGAGQWTRRHQEMLSESLSGRPRPLVVGNPDLVAPLETGLSRQPGFFAHELADRIAITPEFHGKPFPSVFEIVAERLGSRTPAPHRIAMVGDTLHTDVLGGAAAGWRTILVTGFGLFRGLDEEAYIARSGIVPDFIVPAP